MIICFYKAILSCSYWYFNFISQAEIVISLSVLMDGCCFSTEKAQGIESTVLTKASTGMCLDVSLTGFNQPLQVGKNVELRKWVKSKRIAFRQRKLFFLRPPKLGNGKSLLSFSTVIYTCSRLEARLSVKRTGKNSHDGVQWTNASGCRSHYKLVLVMEKSSQGAKILLPWSKTDISPCQAL